MTDYDDYDDQDDVPALLKDLRKQLKIQGQKNKELEDKLAEQTTRTRSMTLAEVLKGAGVNEKVASLVPGDVEPTVDAVGEWLKKYEDVFGVIPKGTESSPAEVEEAAQQMKSMQDVASSGEIKGQDRKVTTSDLKAASSMEELLALIAKGAANS